MRLRKIVSALLLLTLPAQGVEAATWSLAARLMNAGGKLQVANKPIQSGGATVYYNFTTSKPVPVKLLPNAGYMVTAYTVNGVAQPLPAPSSVNVGLQDYPGKTSQSILVYFGVQKSSINATATAGGSVSPSGTSSPPLNTIANYTFTPQAGGQVVSISGLPSDATLTDASTGTPVTLPYAGAVLVSFLVTSTPVRMLGAFIGVGLSTDAIPTSVVTDQVRMRASAVVYDGSSVDSLSYNWVQTEGPTTTIFNANTSTPYFVPASEGNYTFTVTATTPLGSTGSTTASCVVYPTAISAAQSSCYTCHNSYNPSWSTTVFRTWSGSRHKEKNQICVKCHLGADTGLHPSEITPTTIDPTTFVRKATGQVYCVTCHSPSIPVEFATARHSSVITCSSCHVDPHVAAAFSRTTFRTYSTGSYQGRVLCFNCHGGQNTTHYYTKAKIDNICSSCHSASHNPAPFMKDYVGIRHFNGYSSAVNPNYAAAYVNPRTVCTSCHLDNTGFDRYSSQRKQWAGSLHGDTTSPGWKNTADRNWLNSDQCVRCHSSEGFNRFAASGYNADAAISDASPSSGPLSCDACHVSGFQVKTLPAVSIYYNASTAAGRKHTYPDTGKSNVCVACHSDRQSGETISALAARFGNLSGYPGSATTPHALPVAITLYENAYNATVNSQPLILAHDQIGIATGSSNTGDNGPCAGCHMGNKDHSYAAVTKDDTGEIRSVTNQSLCVKCHTAMDATTLSSAKASFNNSLAVLAQLLINKGYINSYSYGGRIATPNLAGAWGSTAKYGAWYNIDLLTRGDRQGNDPGAYVHNPAYARKLVFDAIDTFDDGLLNNSAAATVAAITLDPAKISGIPAALGPDGVKASGSGYLTTDKAGCGVCHSSSVDPKSGNLIMADYAASAHPKKPGGATCANCHAPDMPIAHPAQNMNITTADISARCYGCHGDPLTYKIPHSWNAIGVCSNCHNGHFPLNVTMNGSHYGNYSTAQLVTPNLGCRNCHYELDQAGNTSFMIYSANRQWAREGKGNARSATYTAFDFKAMGNPGAPATSAGNDCVKCHTTTGYANYVDSNFQNINAWGIAGDQPGGDRTREMIACAACHNPTPFKSYDVTIAGTDYIYPAYSRRAVPRVTSYYNYSSQASGKVLTSITMPFDTGESNNCIVCHSGKSAGATIKNIAAKVGASGSFWSNTAFIDPHGMGAAGVLNGKTGYIYWKDYGDTPSSHYTAPGSFVHDRLDLPDSGGPCVACHMWNNKKHLFSPVSTASNGTIAKIRSFDQLCVDCHGGGSADFTLPSALDARKQAFASSLKALVQVLAGKGIGFNPDRAPYFFQAADMNTPYTNWNALAAGNLYPGSDVMGAAFNLKLLWNDKGAYAHNYAFIKRLIYDSIDSIDDGIINGSVSLTLQNLGTGTSFTTLDKSNAQSYVGVRP